MTRNGKIARLPKTVRDQLNRRLLDGEQGKKLVAWLNGLPEVQDVLEVEFDSRPVTEQNLSEWKKGGYEEWCQAQDSIDFASALSEEAEEVEAAAGGQAMIDRVASIVSVSLGRVLRDLSGKASRSARARRELLEIANTLVSLRRSHQHAERLRMKRDWHDRELEAARAKDPTLSARMKEAMRRREMEPLQDMAHAWHREQLIRQWIQRLGAEQEERFRRFVEGGVGDVADDLAIPPMPDSCTVADPTESDPIQVDPSASQAPSSEEAEASFQRPSSAN